MMRPIYLLIFKLIGWRVIGHFPTHLKKYIVAVAPHTSNWDFSIGIMARSIMNVQQAKFLGKDSLFKPPFGWFFRAVGGYPVNRAKNTDMVQQVASIFNAHDEFILGLAPEGTRKKVDKLRTGFYYIAKKANVPIVPCGFDFAKKAVIAGEPFYPTDDFEGDMEYLMSFYRNVTGRNPELGLV
jgi:1-acyl-sn-glycerol-3-phosphate acyltransferase